LIIRNNSKKRSNDINEAFLLKMVSEDSVKDKTDKDSAYFELPHYGENGKSLFASFKQRDIVKLCVLDLCVFNTHGLSEISLEQECPTFILPGWRKNFFELNKQAKKIIEKYKALKHKRLTDEQASMCIPNASHSKQFKGSINAAQDALSYNCRRIGRLLEPRSSGLLRHFTNFISRVAYDVDFARE
jgi:hypothetical protein